MIVVRFIDRAFASEPAEKLRAAVEAHPFVLPDGTVLHKTCSIGYAAWPSVDSPDFKDVVDRADAALYAAKRGGRNAVVAADVVTREKNLA